MRKIISLKSNHLVLRNFWNNNVRLVLSRSSFWSIIILNQWPDFFMRCLPYYFYMFYTSLLLLLPYTGQFTLSSNFFIFSSRSLITFLPRDIVVHLHYHDLFAVTLAWALDVQPVVALPTLIMIAKTSWEVVSWQEFFDDIWLYFSGYFFSFFTGV